MDRPELVDLAAAFPLARLVLQAAASRPGRTVASAESCTGGLLAAALTAVPGSSAYFLGGLVTYDDSAKLRHLEVPQSLLDAHGAVSREVAEAMAVGVRGHFRSSFGVSTTGVAGPGSAQARPAGLVYLAVVGPDRVVVRRLTEDRGRHLNRVGAVTAALELLLAGLEAGD
jgi:PncC family amidohydrolase